MGRSSPEFQCSIKTAAGKDRRPHLSSQGHIEYHHQDKTAAKAQGAQVAVGPFAGLGDQLFHHHIEMCIRDSIYTDGACSGNPGPGGWGAILEWNGVEKELSGGEAQTTNNRMELTGVIRALSALKEPCEVDLYTDSKYVLCLLYTS